LLDSEGFGMLLTRAVMETFTGRSSIAHDDRTDRRVWSGVTDTARRQFAGACEIHPIDRT
jgi:hypothetical protein